MKRVIPYSHQLLKETIHPGDIVVDATMGNGHDTLLLSQLVGETGTVYAFDIQKQALKETEQRLFAHNQPQRQLILDSHANILNHLSPEHHHQITAAIFNLGYLPGSDKSIITTPDSTIEAVTHLITHLKIGGLIILVVYHGHPGGDEERDQLISSLASLDQKEFDVLRYGFINQKNHPPFILAIKKKPRK
ncbi:putative rRNA methylase YtqB [Halolactibacillus alkaliphilus]|uniref:Putative rRNA methylase YtqB n=1 Tax=Halolactibacillus alkaliphilus TaxID=442899 RepID=A0A511X401_9BACI|nr:class I SAM-dependent methyltransferase [Halolactibacillus alkaliphilus]GEN57667.1 putative rRNA methylase YtqB [Halolactibacillus alkaliphilus]GGN74597.1 putative rRNA methylase YtqB [Halolactibacillus alkaliphilus]SFP02713.1 Putative rRNA methylase [Halolactibacillus alkaliphilus]